MTEPTDVAIDTLILELGVMDQAWPTQRQLHAFARAALALAKWGTPAPVGVEPVAWLSPWRADQVTTDYDAYGEHGIPLYTTPQPTQAQAGAVPLTDDQIAEGFAKRSRHIGLFAGGVRFAERHHGIKGGQHG